MDIQFQHNLLERFLFPHYVALVPFTAYITLGWKCSFSFYYFSPLKVQFHCLMANIISNMNQAGFSCYFLVMFPFMYTPSLFLWQVLRFSLHCFSKLTS